MREPCGRILAFNDDKPALPVAFYLDEVVTFSFCGPWNVPNRALVVDDELEDVADGEGGKAYLRLGPVERAPYSLEVQDLRCPNRGSPIFREGRCHCFA